MPKGVSRESPVVTEMSVVPVAGHDSMLLNLSGAHGPLFTRNVDARSPGARDREISATIAQHPTKRRTGRRTMRAIGLGLLSIAIMALLLTDADAKRRSSAQGSQAAGASRSWCAVHPRHGSENCGYTSFDQCWATIGS